MLEGAANSGLSIMRDHIGPAIDIRQTYAFHQAVWKAVLLVLGAAAFVAVSVLMVLGVIDGVRFGMRAETIGWIGLAVFGPFLLIALWRLIFMRGPVLTISPKGLRDVRIAADVIPWAAIERVSVWQAHKQKFLVLGVAPAVEDRIGLTRMARWTRRANRSLGADGLCIGPQGLPLSFDDLGRLVAAHLDARAA